MNETISAVLREHADGDIHVERLLGAVHAGARRRRRHRLALTGGALAAVVASVGVTGSLYEREPATVGVPAPDINAPRPPRVDGAPAMERAPEVMGADPTLFHLDLIDLSDAKSLSWSSRRDHEELMLTTVTGDEVFFETDRDPARLRPRHGTPMPVTVNGRPGEASTSMGKHVIRWQPVNGIWAQASGPGDVPAVVALAERLRLDRVYRCALPFRLTGITSVRLVKCEVFFGHDDTTGEPGAGGGVWLTAAPGSDTEYYVGDGLTDPSIVVNDTIDGRAVEAMEGNGGNPASLQSWRIRYPYSDRRAGYFWVFGPADVSLLRSLVAAYTPVGSEDLATWPSNPLN